MVAVDTVAGLKSRAARRIEVAFGSRWVGEFARIKASGRWGPRVVVST